MFAEKKVVENILLVLKVLKKDKGIQERNKEMGIAIQKAIDRVKVLLDENHNHHLEISACLALASLQGHFETAKLFAGAKLLDSMRTTLLISSFSS